MLRGIRVWGARAPASNLHFEVLMRPLFPFALLAFTTSALAATWEDVGFYVPVTSDLTAVRAVSGLAGLRGEPNGNGHDDEIALWGVGDDSLSPSRIWGMTASDDGVAIVSELYLTQGGAPVTYDIEGIDVDGAGGWWLAVEGAGNAPNIVTPNLLLHVDATGAITETVALPAAVAARQSRFGFEGVAANDDATQLYVAFQGEWGDDPAGLLRIGRYTPATGEWAFYHYPRNFGPGRVGLSEITWAGDDRLIVLERDNLVTGTQNKRLYVVSVAGVEPAPAGQAPPVLDPWLVRDLLNTDGWPFEKAEGVAIVDGDVLVVNDNDNLAGAPTDALVLDKLARHLEE